MGNSLSVAAVVLAAAGAVAYVQYNSPKDTASTAAPKQAVASKKDKGAQKRKRPTAAAPSKPVETEPEPVPTVLSLPPATTIPGDFETAADSSDAPAKAKKPKKKKAAKKPATPVPEQAPSAVPKSPVKDEQWTRVETRRRALKTEQPASEGLLAPAPAADSVQSDSITTSVTGTSTPTSERTDDEDGEASGSASAGNTRTLAEKLLPKPRKTGVEGMLETPDYPTLARVMRVVPREDEKPAAGFSWGDYEDVRTGNEADGEGDGGGWGVVKTKSRTKLNRTSSSPAPPEESNKKQRQNAAKREAQKAAKAEGEAQRLALLNKHKRELERERIAEQFKSGGSKTPGAGQSASIDERGKLVWE